jgi:hypothetical protein
MASPPSEAAGRMASFTETGGFEGFRGFFDSDGCEDNFSG